jgi:DNA-directed RNA polymerase subunit D
MEIEILSVKKDTYPNEMTFKLKDSNPAFANALRRVLLMEVPVLAMDEIIILENTTPLYDEIIAHRLGLIPVTTPVGEFNLREECVCEGHGCTQCEISLTLDVESDAAGEIETVYSGSFIPDDPKVKPVIDNIPILRFTKGQKITIQAIARMGLGRNHAKWQASIVSYKYDPIIEIDNSAKSNWQEIVDICPPKILQLSGKNLTVTDPTECILCGLCTEKVTDGSITVETSGKDFIFSLTTLGQMSLKDLLQQGITAIQNKAKEFQIKSEELSVQD